MFIGGWGLGANKISPSPLIGNLLVPISFYWTPAQNVFIIFFKQDHLRMNVAPDQTIILGLEIFLDHRSLSSIDQQILMTQSCFYFEL